MSDLTLDEIATKAEAYADNLGSVEGLRSALLIVAQNVRDAARAPAAHGESATGEALRADLNLWIDLWLSRVPEQCIRDIAAIRRRYAPGTPGEDEAAALAAPSAPTTREAACACGCGRALVDSDGPSGLAHPCRNRKDHTMIRSVPGAFCCFEPCGKPATWEVVTGHSPDDYTHACNDHAGHLAHHAEATGPLGGGRAELEPIDAAAPASERKGDDRG
jgi:hypothetical protein